MRHVCFVGALAALACDDAASERSTRIDRPHPVVIAEGGAAPDTTSPDTGTDTGIEVADTIDTTAPDTIAPPDTADAATDSAQPVDTADTADTTDTAVPDTTTPPLFPFVRSGDTRTSASDAWDRYACAPDTDESGAEDVYPLDVEHMGILRARVNDTAGDGVDVDVHLLAARDPAACVRRDNTALAWVVRPGTWYVAVDTWVGGDGLPRSGAYTLEVDFVPLDSGPCALDDVAQRMFWSACAPGPPFIDCRDEGGERYLATPSLGPLVKEAHLVTVDEPFPGNGWPTSFTDQIERHYALSEAATGYLMTRDEPWAPAGEGGSEFGGGATGQKLPVLDEAWYVNMYWRTRPARGRRMLVVEPFSGRAVVTAGGWETGPGANTAIGGAVEEIHHHLGTSHRDDAVMGFLSDDTLPLGPITCW